MMRISPASPEILQCSPPLLMLRTTSIPLSEFLAKLKDLNPLVGAISVFRAS